MLLLLIAVPVIIVVTASHGLLQAYAPSNLLIRHLRASRRTFRTAIVTAALAFACAAGVHAITRAIDAGAPGWLNLIVLVLAWDAIKLTALMVMTAGRAAISGVGGTRRVVPMSS